MPATEASRAVFASIVVDITGRKRAEETLRQSQAELARVARVTTIGELGASIAHEINQPLAAIAASGNACQRWLENGQNLARAKESLNRIISDANRASDVIKRIRALTNRKPPEHLELGINEVVDEVLTFARNELRAKGILIRRELRSDLPSVMGDRVQLQQVILNLVMNGIDAMADVTDRRRILSVKSQLDERGSVLVTVQDSGAGLDPQHAETYIQCVLHDQARRDGDGIGDQHVDHRSSWWPSLGLRWGAPRYRVSFHAASDRQERVVIEQSPTVVVVDDDPSIRTALNDLFQSVGLQVRVFESAREFLANQRPDGPCCLVLDVRLPGKSGLDFQRELNDENVHLPIIFLTGHGDIPMSVRAMKAGAVEFLTKPFREQDLLDAVQVALDRDRATREDAKLLAALQRRFASLTPREQAVMGLIVAGRRNKQIAGEIGTSEVTVKVHRSNLMRKMEALSLADLIVMAGKLGLAGKG